MFTITIRELLSHKRRLLATAFAVVLGVAFLAGTFVFTDSMGSTLDGVLADGNRGTDAYVRAPVALTVGFGQPRPGIPADIVGQIRGIPGVASAAPRIHGYAQLVDKAGKPVGDQAQGAPLFGENWVQEPSLNPYRIVDGRPPQRSGEVVVDRSTARSAHLRVGDRVGVLTKSEPRDVTIVGVATYGAASSPGGAHSVLFSDTDAQALIAKPGYVDGIAVTATDGVSQADLVRRVQDRLRAASTGRQGSPSLEVLTGAALTSETQSSVHKSLAKFNTFLLVFAGVAVFVGAFIINNTFSILVAQRTRSFALLRAIGANGRQILSAVVAESLAVGVMASAAGIAVGFAVAKGLGALLTSLGVELPTGSLLLEHRTVVVSMAVGVLVTLVSALLPARRAARIAPIAALREVAIDGSATSKLRVMVGASLSALGVTALLGGLSGDGNASLVGIGATIVFLGVAVLGPVIARPFVRLVGMPLPRLRGITGTLAVENAARNPKRTARTAAALMIGVGLVGFITVFAASAKTSLAGSIKRNYRGDYVVDSGDYTGMSGISPALAADLRKSSAVAVVTANRVATAKVGTALLQPFNGWDPSTVGLMANLGHVQGDVTSLDSDGLAVEKVYAAARDWRVGSDVSVTFAAGIRHFTVRAIFDRSDDLVGKVFAGVDAMPSELDARVYVKSAGSSSSALPAITAAAKGYPAVKVLDTKGLVKNAAKEIDMILGLIYAMLALAVLIALLGIANTLALSVHERTRELGLLRAVGMSRAQMRASVRWESVLVSLFGTGLGLLVGTFFGWAMVRALADEGVDQLSVPVGALVVVTLVAGVAGVLAAIRPARRAARLDVLAAVASS